MTKAGRSRAGQDRRSSSAARAHAKPMKKKGLSRSSGSSKRAVELVDPLVQAQLKLYEAAVLLLHQQKYQKAKQELEKVVTGPSKEFADRAQMHLRVVQQRMSRIAEHNPRTPEDHYQQGGTMMNRGRWHEAREHLLRARRLAPNLPARGQAMMVVGLFPERLGRGGVRRAGQHLAAVASALAGERNLACELLSLNDPSDENSLDVAGVQFTFTGFARSKRRFVTAAMRASRRGARVVIAAHPNLASVVLAMRLARPRLHSIICTHGIEVWKPLSYLRRFALQRANLVLAPSRDTAERAAHTQNLPVLNVRRLPWTLDPAFATRAAL